MTPKKKRKVILRAMHAAEVFISLPLDCCMTLAEGWSNGLEQMAFDQPGVVMGSNPLPKGTNDRHTQA